MLLNQRYSGAAGTAVPARSEQSHRDTAAVGRRILETLLDGYHGRVAVKLWDGTHIHGDDDAVAALHIREPAALRELVLHPDLVRMAENYLDESLDVRGRMDLAFDIVDFLRTRAVRPLERARLFAQALKLPASRRRPRSGGEETPRTNGVATIAHHYDVSNDFYRRWLDREMVYSCAYFAHPEQSLDDAQRDKLDYICRKLRLRPGQRLLDIGCGWGALAIWAARHYGVHVHGITLSAQQCEHARARVRAEDLEDRVYIELRDYRGLQDTPRYDRVVSVGMFEHVGIGNLPKYFAVAKRVLRPGGLFLNHGITNDRGWVGTETQRFINRHVFPDGELTRVSAVQDYIERAGFEILDAESLRPHYALTLRNWLRRFEYLHEELASLVGERLYRIWRLYLGGSAHYFQRGSLNVYQILVGHAGGERAVPLRRDDLYRRA